MAEISDVVKVTINVGQALISRAGFGTPLILGNFETTVFPERVREFANLADVAEKFPNTTKVYKAANAIFAQRRSPERIKVGRKSSGDANITAALNAIEAEDPDWYCLLAEFKTSAQIQEIATWIATRRKILIASSEDADVLTAVTTDIASILKAAAHNRTGYLWHHQAGVDSSAATATIASNVITVLQAIHGLKVGDPATVSGHPQAGANGNFLVDTVPGSGSFTYKGTGLTDDAVAKAITYFARYTFPETAWAGLMLPTTPGSETWKFKNLTGIIATPKSELDTSEEGNAKGKNANVYVPIAGLGATLEGVMASGRFIDIQRGIDWLQARLEEGIYQRLAKAEKVPYTDGGGMILFGEIAAVLDEGVRNGLLGPLLNSESGEFYRITIPKVASQSQADRDARNFTGITVEAQLAGAVHKLEITVNASI